MYLGAISYIGSLLITVSAMNLGFADEANPITRLILSHPILTVFWSLSISLGIAYPAYKTKAIKSNKIAYGMMLICIILILNFLRELLILIG